MNKEQIEQMKRTYAWNNVSFDPERRMENFIASFKSRPAAKIKEKK